ncbi:hypothetical protein B0T24DRAFT_126388 [Lasiosphaeria ovina]|uniref:Inner centromere protein ARK-binding domain-containing protein n=1 Tax=Lasiosphaeria ovina TaxID=92902 RepID=A0AAE0JRY8_9PEZI|nr:hypothetical protein B0T24DRAFT_126388 [Lasiosphaeria ovina]
MAMRGGPRLQVGSAAWAAEERSAALGIAESEIEEFSFAARNELDWLNEHMAEIFSENQVHVTELFKTPGKLRGRTPRTARKANPEELRVPLSDVFSTTPKGAPNLFALAHANQARTPKIKVAEDRPKPSVSRPTNPAKTTVAAALPPAPASTALADSGYHGSQSHDTDTVDFDPIEPEDVHLTPHQSPVRGVETTDFAIFSAPRVQAERPSPATASPEETFQSAKEDQTTRQVTTYVTAKVAPPPSPILGEASSPAATRAHSPIMSPQSPSPQKMTSPIKSSPHKSSPLKPAQTGFPKPVEDLNEEDDEARSPSDGSSPIRPIVRKSSLNFASLPAREPLTSNKSLGGNRISRTSHLDLSRPSYFNRPTGGKSLGNTIGQDTIQDDHDEMDVDEETTIQPEKIDPKVATHNKTYTQRLQDQISMLGKSQSIGPRPSKSMAHLPPTQQAPTTVASSSQPLQTQALEGKRASSPKPTQSTVAPGAFPEDDDDDWIEPPSKAPAVAASHWPELPKSHSTDIMEDVVGMTTVGGSEFTIPKSRPGSPGKAPVIPERTAGAATHHKSASVPYLPNMDPFTTNGEAVSPKKGISVSNPSLATVSEDGSAATASKSPSRGFRDSPLKQVKNKLSSILGRSKVLLASSAAISAEGKTSLLSPSTSRLGYFNGPSVESFMTAENVLYPDLSQHGASTSRPASPARTNSTRRTRASSEREKKEAKEREKEAKEKEKEIKEAKRHAEQMEKLEKAREKEREKARVFSKEKERVISMEKQVVEQKEPEKAPQPPAQAFKTPGPAPKSAPQSPPKATRTSPRKPKGQADGDTATADFLSDDGDVEMVDVPNTMPPPSIPRSAVASAARGQTLKRPTKPSKENIGKSRQAPTVIRVNTNSSQQSHFHPPNSVLAATLQETLGQQKPQAPPRQLTSKASATGSLRAKSSFQNLNSSVSSAGRPKALDMAAKRKEQEDRDAQRKREAKLEMERKRAAQEEERRQEEQRRGEAERQKAEDRKQAAKRAAIEKAKQTKAPPPASRTQPNGPPEYNMADKGPSRPVSRLGSTMHQDNRLVNTVLSNTGKAASKRPLPQDSSEDNSRPQPQPQRNLVPYQSKESKRMRMSEEFDEDIDMADSQRNIKGPPVRPPGAFKKELPSKSMLSNGYTPAPPQSIARDLFKATVTEQHNRTKAMHPLDMAQVSKAEIVFAPNSNAAGQAHKTPARPANAKAGAKSAARSSPRFPNPDGIELPEIQTDDEDDEDDGQFAVAAWADSPALRRALAEQERVDPMQIFGPPAPLNMEEVFTKSKDRWHKFRARTSSANWSGSDRLTEEDIRKDLQARDKIRRQGGWSYELGREIQ